MTIKSIHDTSQGLKLRPSLHEQIKHPLFVQILDQYEVTPDEFAQIKHVLFAHVNAA